MAGAALDFFEWIDVFDPEDGSTSGQWQPPAGYQGLVIDVASYEQIVDARPGQPRGLFFGAWSSDSIPQGIADRGGVIVAREDVRDALPDNRARRAVAGLIGFLPEGDTLADWILSIFTRGADPQNSAAVAPLIPTASRRLLVHFGGLKLLDQPFRFSVGDPYSQKLLTVLKAQLGGAREESLGRKLTNPVTNETDDEYHLRMADALLEKYVGRDIAAKQRLWAALKPANWQPDENPLPHATTITDDFNTADSGTVGHLLTWNEVNGVWNNTNNAAQNDSGGGTNSTIRAESDLSSSDHYAQASAISLPNSTARYAAAACRFASAANTFYMTRIEGNATLANSTCRIGKHVTGTTTLLGTGTTVSANSLPKVVKHTVNGSSLTSRWDGVDQETVSPDTSITTGTRCGLLAMSGGASKVAFDDFEAGDLTAGITYSRLERGIRGLNRGLAVAQR